MNDVIKHKIKHNTQRFITSMKWIVFSILSGLIIGSIGSAFYGCIKMVTELRMEHLWLLYLLPLGGMVISSARSALQMRMTPELIWSSLLSTRMKRFRFAWHL